MNNIEEWMAEYTIHKIVGGSRLYGTNRADSDFDIRGVCLTPVVTLLGLTHFEQYQGNAENDTVIYSLRRFAELALDNNPNILDILCAPPDRWLAKSKEWELIYKNRGMFLSQRLRHTFSGYALSQLKRIDGHRKWLLHPPESPPDIGDYCGALETDSKGGQRKVFKNDDYRAQYEKAEANWKQYSRWLLERNPARAELEKRYGYDTKHAAHLVRLLVKCQGILLTGDYDPVLNADEREYVLGILRGDYSYEYVVGFAREMDDRINGLDSVLPKTPDRGGVEEIIIGIHYASLSRALKTTTTSV